ncbi:hypothetical protein CALCODRAFT_540172 [Calocera cornea HHB12733]|uniref:Uncharacterized protein n=1 Tax=Calocera cornea HHB12733 TaxID=1353952 RepID=A0A166MQ03_9BASI|nr:hypothetical protein CALCODRAFT_540172 [Calocera cornea HHB12733]
MRLPCVNSTPKVICMRVADFVAFIRTTIIIAATRLLTSSLTHHNTLLTVLNTHSKSDKMSDIYLYLLFVSDGSVQSSTPVNAITHTEEQLTKPPKAGTVVPKTAYTGRYPFEDLAYLNIDTSSNSILGQAWTLRKWFLSTYRPVLDLVNKQGKLRVETHWRQLISYRRLSGPAIESLTVAEREKGAAVWDEIRTLSVKVAILMDDVKNKRSKRIKEVFLDRPPSLNAMSTFIRDRLLEDLDANTLAIRGILDKSTKTESGEAARLSVMSAACRSFAEAMSAGDESSFQALLAAVDCKIAAQHRLKLLEWDYCMLQLEQVQWISPHAGFQVSNTSRIVEEREDSD